MFEHCLYFTTTSLARQLEREWAHAFKPFGLTPAQAFMLRVILEKSPITHTDLAAEMNITKATCSRTVEGLIRLSLVSRSQAETDARSFELMPTDAALSIRAEINQASRAVTKKIKHIIGGEAFDTTVSRMRGIHQAIR